MISATLSSLEAQPEGVNRADPTFGRVCDSTERMSCSPEVPVLGIGLTHRPGEVGQSLTAGVSRRKRETPDDDKGIDEEVARQLSNLVSAKPV